MNIEAEILSDAQTLEQKVNKLYCTKVACIGPTGVQPGSTLEQAISYLSTALNLLKEVEAHINRCPYCGKRR